MNTPSSNALIYNLFLTAMVSMTIWILHPFAIPLIAGLMMAVASSKPLAWLAKKSSVTWSAFALTLLWTIILFGPVILVLPVLEAGVKLAVAASYTPAAVLQALLQLPLVGGFIGAHTGVVLPWLVSHPFFTVLSTYADTGTAILQAASSLLWHTLLALLVLFVLLSNSHALISIGHSLLGRWMGNIKGNVVLLRSAEVIKSVMQGTVSLLVWDGVLGALLFVAFGINPAGLWAIALAISSLVPMGTGAILLAASALLAAHSVTQAVFFLLFGQIIALLGDWVVKPKIIGAGADAPFLLVLLSIIGGVAVFGLIGVIAGPVIAIMTKDFLLAE